MFYNNATRTITFKPDSKKYAGKTYYFNIVVKEKNSNSPTNRYAFYSTVRVKGEVDDEKDIVYGLNTTQVNYTINWVNDKGLGSLKFTSPINMDWLEQNFADFFHIFWRDTTYR
jgi:hypothetical protein